MDHLNLLSIVIHKNYNSKNQVNLRKFIFNFVQNLPYQINWFSKPEQVIDAWAWYCVSKHRLLRDLFKEIWIDSYLCYVPFSFWNAQLPKYLQGWWMAKKDWYHVFLQAKIEWKLVYIDASFPISFSDIYPTSKERDWIHDMTPFWWPYENILVCTSKEEENSAKKEFTQNTTLDTEDEKWIKEFNEWSMNHSNS